MAPSEIQDLISLMHRIVDSQERIETRLTEIETQLHYLAGANKPTPCQELPLKDAWGVLGYPSYTACWRKIGKLYRVGVEALDRRNPGSSEPNWYLDIEKCRERERVTAAKRSRK